ncbi:hypothetical protein HCN44_001167 [Aphidius gifuensis]|uniref:USP domain-containing protein n=1 Tax=Aphidius gifuensis TaxID=684658 RepID=A0A835CMN4_APHGI|nr:ubiquitin carboxyl-terminal hydrolase 35-like [Aphidius gifuensis]KAF7988594.1 hypothetical protein HCN44_001167 [Aphidius gifuensis]
MSDMMDCDEITTNPEFLKYLTMVVMGSPDDIEIGWNNLNKYDEKLQDNNLHDISDIIRMIVGREIKNINQVPKLMIYFSQKLKDNPFDVNNLHTNNYTLFLKNTAYNDIELLSDIIDTLLLHKNIYLSTLTSKLKFCEAAVRCLGDFKMPDQPNLIVTYRKSSLSIQQSINKLFDDINIIDKEKLIFKCLETLYDIISDINKNYIPGAALVGILQLVQDATIEKSVRWIIVISKNDDCLEEALKTLCTWLTQCLHDTTLNKWITNFINCLEEVKKYNVLTTFADEFLPKMIQLLKVPMARSHSVAVIYRILRSQSTPTLFHRVIKDIEITFINLSNDTSDSSKNALQSLVDCTKALILRFPGYSIYNKLEKAFPLEPRNEVVNKILKGPQWIGDNNNYDNKIVTNKYYFNNYGKVGLTNLGNTCYMNSVLQALVMTKQFCQQVLLYKSTIDNNNTNIILKKLQNLFALLLYSKRITLSPTEVLYASRPAYFTPGQQQDSSEFLCHLLDVIYEQEKSISSQTDDIIKILNPKINEPTCDVEEISMDIDTCGTIKRWTTEEDLTEGTTLIKTHSLDDFTDGNELATTPQLSDSHSDSTDSGIQSVGGDDTLSTNLVYRVFGGESKITYKCAQCNTSSHNTDKFRDLQLCFPEKIQENQDVSVQDLINYYLTPEKLTGDNKYRCDKCIELCDAQRIIKILRSPSHLILTLKHFHYDTESRLRTKLRHKVIYNETIKLPVTTQSSTIDENYKLYAAVVHCGYSMDYGHYFTYARDSKLNWYKFNDSYVSKTTFEDFKCLESPDTPYILFYEKIQDNHSIDNNNNDDNDKPDIKNLNKYLQDLINNDHLSYNDDFNKQNEKKNSQSERNILTTYKKNDNYDDDNNPPPSNCRSEIDMQHNRYLF